MVFITAQEKRAAVAALIRSRLKKNHYTQGANRNRVFEEPTGWGDCSSTVRAVYKRALGIDIGGNTAAQIVSKKGADVDIGNGAAYPKEKNLLPGDCLYFKGTDENRPFCVGHVEMYVGNGKLIGHGSGLGPTAKSLKTYCKYRKSRDRGYIKTRRFIPDAAAHTPAEEFIAPANPLARPSSPAASGSATVTGGQVHLRTGPAKDFDVVRVVPQGTVLPIVATDGWLPVLLDGEVVWVSQRYVRGI